MMRNVPVAEGSSAMSWSVVTMREGFREYRIWGDLTMEDLRTLREHNVFPEEERPGLQIVDIREMALPAMTMGTVAAGIGFRHDDEDPPFLAFIVGSPVMFGTVRQLVQYQGVGHRVRVFREHDEAMAWLFGPHPAADEVVE